MSAAAAVQVRSARRIARNAAALLLAYVLPRAFGLIGVVAAARVLGAERFGQYGTAAALAVILSIVATLGLMPLLIREIARSPAAAAPLLAAGHRIKTLANVGMLAALYVLARWVLDYPAVVVTAALLLGIGYAIGAYAENFGAYFHAVERMGIWTQASALNGLTTGALGAALVIGTGTVVWFCAAPIVGQAVALGWLVARSPRGLRSPLARPAPGAVVRLGRSLLPFAAAFVALTVYYKVDVLLLARWRSAAEVGIYTAAYKFVDIAHALTLVAAGAVYPRLSRTAEAARRDERWTGARAVELILLAAVPAAGTLWLAREPLVGLLYGAAYLDAARALGWLAAVLPALALNLLAVYVLGAVGRMRRVAVAYAAAAALNIALNALLIPAWGAVGAGAAMLGSEIVLAGTLGVALAAEAGAMPRARAVAGLAAAALLCVAIAGLPLPALVAAGLYPLGALAMYAAVRAIPRGEVRTLRATFAVGGRGRP